MKADLAYDSGQHSVEIPSATESERIIAEKAPAAIRALKQFDATDLYEALGLTAYLSKEDKNGRQD